MKTKLFVAVAVLCAASFGAGCDDTTNTGGAGGATSTSGSTTKATTGATMTTTGATMTSSSTGAPLCPVTGTTDTCANACAALYDCGALTCNGTDLCPGFSGMAAEKTAFIGDAMNGCVKTCTAQGALKALIDPTDCASTIKTIKMVSDMDFAPVCENGFGMGTTASSSSTGP